MAAETIVRRPTAWTHQAARGGIVLLVAALLAGCARVREAAEVLPGVEPSLTASLTGGAEVPGPGDPDGNGSATVRIDVEDAEVCYDIDVSNVGPPSAAHIHRGAAGASGPPVVDFQVPQNGLEGCVAGMDRNLLQSILDNPAGFYVNVHNANHPAGAVRGQLRR